MPLSDREEKNVRTYPGRRIAVDLRRVENVGIGRYMTCLFDAMLQQNPADEFVFISPPGSSISFYNHPNARIVASRLPYYSVQEQIGLPNLLRQNQAEVFHSPHFLLPVVRPCKTVVTIHDVIYLRFKQDLGSLIARLYYSAAIRMAARLADKVLTDSEFSKAEILRCLKVDEDRIVVIPLAAGTQFHPVIDSERLKAARETYALPERFFLSVGIQRHRKNLPRLISAFNRLVTLGYSDIHLVIAGQPDPRHLEVAAIIEELKLKGLVHCIGPVLDPDLPSLYCLASALVFPSLYEGFGLPVLEAMACGTPVITSNLSSLPEVAGDAAFLVDPRSVEEIAAAMAMLLDRPSISEEMRHKGMLRNRQFSWAETARRTREAYESVLVS